MTHAQTVAGYVVLAVTIASVQLVGWRRGRPAPLGRILATLATWPPTRWPLLAAWLWLGWHLFARTDWR
jgi:Family of unknown function (DUF6186)